MNLPLDEAADAVLPAPGRRTPTRRRCSPTAARWTAVGIAGPYAVFGPDGGLIAIVSERDGRARAEIVLAPA